jgi:hypothetical protein
MMEELGISRQEVPEQLARTPGRGSIAAEDESPARTPSTVSVRLTSPGKGYYAYDHDRWAHAGWYCARCT